MVRGPWGMGNGEWGMGSGEWGMGNGEWGVGNGEWDREFSPLPIRCKGGFIKNFYQPQTHCLNPPLPTPYSLLPTPYSLLPTPY
ncbi:hypothetical protein, partial [Nodularia spumigena]|uniref:hypothetical protein n=1 Tax=Nodularia spumigena TaxID=70799 RepID=UPI002B218911